MTNVHGETVQVGPRGTGGRVVRTTKTVRIPHKHGESRITRVDELDDEDIVPIQIPGPKGDKGDQGDQGLQGTPGAPGGTGPASYRHIQGTPAATWSIPHGLGFYPNVTVVDSSHRQVEGDVDFPDGDTVVVSFRSAFSGEAYLS